MNPQESNQEELDIINAFEPEEGENVDFEFTAAQENSEKVKETLLKARAKDIKDQQVMRKLLLAFFCLLLVGQNVGMFYIVYTAMQYSNAADLQNLLTFLGTATIAETYGIARIIVRWAFKDIKYD